MKNLVVVNAGLSNPSTTRDVAMKVAEAVQRRADVQVSVLDLRSLAGDLATFMSTMIPTQSLNDVHATISSADAIIAATPVFQASYSGLFKMFFDTLDKTAITGIPVSLVATAGTARHSMVLDYAMRPLFSYLQATVLPTGVFAATDDFGGTDSLDARYERAAAEIVAALGQPEEGAVGPVSAAAADGAGVVGKPSLSPAPAMENDTFGVAVGTAADAMDAAFELDGDSFHALLGSHSGSVQ